MFKYVHTTLIPSSISTSLNINNSTQPRTLSRTESKLLPPHFHMFIIISSLLNGSVWPQMFKCRSCAIASFGKILGHQVTKSPSHQVSKSLLQPLSPNCPLCQSELWVRAELEKLGFLHWEYVRPSFQFGGNSLLTDKFINGKCLRELLKNQNVFFRSDWPNWRHLWKF